ALASIPAHRIARLRRQGERYFTDGLRDITSDRRWAILAVCVVGVRLEKGNYPTLSAFFAQMATD
ncbi:hypothetical protein QUG53_24520, partial [Enterobacter asburiae]|uniref:hypothetical protein n=1 Tax=Enterobacter asburiae TaxID=61645 RepID=UPI0025A18826